MCKAKAARGRLALVALLSALVLYACARPTTISPLATPRITPPPAPTWGPLPTRLPAASPTPTPDVEGPLRVIETALRNGDVAMAQTAWERIESMAIPPSGSPQTGGSVNAEVARAGARLALAQGEFDAAEARAWYAIAADPQDATSWSLLGEVLSRRDALRAAEQALRTAQALEPELASALFVTRWRAAHEAQDGDAMAALADAAAATLPNAPLTSYYQAATLLINGDTRGAMTALLATLTEQPDAPAVLWYTLAEVYARRGAWAEAITALTVVEQAMARGDVTVSLASEDPPRDVALALSEAYIHAGRCAEAEARLEPLVDAAPEIAPLLERAIRCQTPTPTLTPWIPSQQVTSTPTPLPEE